MLKYAKILLLISGLVDHLLVEGRTDAVGSSLPGKGPGTQTFLSRPGQYSVKLDVHTFRHPKELGPGYIFTSPYGAGGNYGVHIYENSGELVFVGTYLQEVRAMDSHVCNYLGKEALCFTDAVPGPLGSGHSPGQDRFFDKHYKQLGHDYGSVNGLVRPDAHELNTPSNLNGTRFINDVFQPHKANLTLYQGPLKGWIISGCFQQRKFEDDSVEFQWCSADHVPLYETYYFLANNTVGNNTNPKDQGTLHHPWDYFHINAIDRDDKGDYYVSSRQTRTIYKIAGPDSHNPGHIIWRLGGKYNDFQIKGKRFAFSAQHDVRLQKLKGHETLLSIYDNHFPRPEHERGPSGSRAIYVRLNTQEMTQELVGEYIQPEHLTTPTGGQVQTLANGNVFVGWGSNPSVAEYRHSGELLYYATFDKGYKSYRSYKQKWRGEPTDPPDVFAYQQKCKSTHIAVYMSWNGATEHKSWQVYGLQGEGTEGGDQLGGTFKRTGYETVAYINVDRKLYPNIYVKAFGRKGEELGTSNATKLFVPKPDLARKCNHMRCPDGVAYGDHHNQAPRC